MSKQDLAEAILAETDERILEEIENLLYRRQYSPEEEQALTNFLEARSKLAQEEPSIDIDDLIMEYSGKS